MLDIIPGTGHTVYRVTGVVSGRHVNATVRGNTGADAYHAVIDPLIPAMSGADWRQKRREWISKNVRLNVTQIS